jgi:hypothetical protein
MAPPTPFVAAAPPPPWGASDWIVVSVVVSDRTDGAGDEKVLSPPRRESTPPPAVRLVPVSDDAPCDRAVMDCDVSWSVDTVGATDRAPAVGGGPPSIDDRTDRPDSEVALPLGPVEKDCVLPLCGAVAAASVADADAVALGGPSREDCG